MPTPLLRFDDLLRALRGLGYEAALSGSHVRLRCPGRKPVTVPRRRGYPEAHCGQSFALLRCRRKSYYGYFTTREASLRPRDGAQGGLPGDQRTRPPRAAAGERIGRRPIPRAVIFDLFSTLIDDFADEAFDRMSERLGVGRGAFLGAWSPYRLPRYFGELSFDGSVRATCRDLGIDETEEAVLEAAFIRVESVRNSLRSLRPGAASIVAALEGLDLRTGLLSNASSEVVDYWAECDLAGCFDVEVFSAGVSMAKPDPRIFRVVCNRLSVDPQDCLYVGDGGDHELAAAAELGMTAIQVRTERPRQPGAAYVIDRVDDVLAFVDSPGAGV